MSRTQKFRKNNWSEDDREVNQSRKDIKKKKLDRALRTRDIDFFNDEDETY